MKNVEIGWSYYCARAANLSRKYGITYKLIGVGTWSGIWTITTPEQIKDLIWHVVYDTKNNR